MDAYLQTQIQVRGLWLYLRCGVTSLTYLHLRQDTDFQSRLREGRCSPTSPSVHKILAPKGKWGLGNQFPAPA